METMLKKIHHPGITLCAELRKRNMDIQTFSDKSKIPFYRAWNFCNGRRKLTNGEIDKLCLVLKADFSYWRDLQRKYYHRKK